MEKEAKFRYDKLLPTSYLSDYVECYWYLENITNQELTNSILPDGYFDIIYRLTEEKQGICTMNGIWTREIECVIQPNTTFFAISFKPLAAEYLLKSSIAILVDAEMKLPENYWPLGSVDFRSLESFQRRVNTILLNSLSDKVDTRKVRLFDLLFSTKGNISVAEISETVSWNSRQINRYFNRIFGMSLKVYADILRYRASFQNLKEQQLYPEQNFSDQAHYIREVRKYSGVTPKELAKNQNDRFIQLSTLTKS